MENFKKNYYIKIQDGCSQNCSYCIVHILRGKPQSESYEEIYNSVKLCIEDLDTDIIQLEGTNSIEYFHESVGDIIDLCKKLIEDFPNKYFLIANINPFNIEKTKKLITFIENEPHMIKTTLLPIQSGSDSVLKRMRRPHNQKDLKNLFTFAKEHNVYVRTEVITGFPGETEEEFNDTYNFLNEVFLASFDVHIFSPRPGTDAYNLTKDPDTYIENHYNRLKELQKEVRNRFKNFLINKEVDIICEPAHGLRTIHHFETNNYINTNKIKIIKAKVLSVLNNGKLNVSLLN